MKIHPFYALLLVIVTVIPFLFVGVEYFSPLTIIFLTVPLVIGLPYVIATYKKRKIAKEEWRESISEGGIEESRPFRDLTEGERISLEKKHKWSKLVLNSLWWIIPLFIIVDIFLGISFFKYLANPISSRMNKDYFVVIVIAFIVQAYLVKLATVEGSSYADLRSPVFRVQGRVIKEKVERRGGTDYYVTVRRIQFSDASYPNLRGMFDGLKDGDELAVEYSPRTKHVWKMYKTEDLK